MEAIVTFGSRSVSGYVVSLISVALVLCGTSGRAEQITEFGLDNASPAGLLGHFSRGDLERLNDADAAQVTAARLAILKADDAPVPEVRPRTAAPRDGEEIELFVHSRSVMPLLTTPPDAAASGAWASLSVRPGRARPVGVSPTSLRSPTPAERAAR